jgi:hypothetical protein
VAAATLADTGAQSASASSPLPILIIAVLALMLAYAGIRLRRHRQRRKLEDFWQHQDADWEATVHQLETERTLGAWKPSAEQLQKVDAA